MNQDRLSTVAQQERSQFFLPRTAAGGLPLAMKIADLSRFSEIRQLREGQGENLFMLSMVSWVGKGATDRMIDKNPPRGRDLGHDV